jgi:hypothetical protein
VVLLAGCGAQLGHTPDAITGAITQAAPCHLSFSSFPSPLSLSLSPMPHCTCSSSSHSFPSLSPVSRFLSIPLSRSPPIYKLAAATSSGGRWEGGGGALEHGGGGALEHGGRDEIGRQGIFIFFYLIPVRLTFIWIAG